MSIPSQPLKTLLLSAAVSTCLVPSTFAMGFSSQKGDDLTPVKATQLNDIFPLKDGFGDSGRSPKRASGGSRGPCIDQLIALIPGAEEIGLAEDSCGDGSDAFTTATVEERPIFWFYVPDALPPRTMAILTLVNVNNPQVHASQSVILPEQAGLIAIQSTNALNVGDIYDWDFEIQLYSGSGSARNPKVNGVIRRQPLTAEIEDQLNSLEAAEKINLYLQNNLWNDALNELARFRESISEDTVMVQEWQALLTQGGLSILSQQPILDCCVADDE